MHLELLEELSYFLLMGLLYIRKCEKKVLRQCNHHSILWGKRARSCSESASLSVMKIVQPSLRSAASDSACWFVRTQTFGPGHASSAIATISPEASATS